METDRPRRGCMREPLWRFSGTISRREAGAVRIEAMATISEALAIAVQHHQAGRRQAAEQIYRQILAVDPNNPTRFTF